MANIYCVISAKSYSTFYFVIWILFQNIALLNIANIGSWISGLETNINTIALNLLIFEDSSSFFIQMLLYLITFLNICIIKWHF